MFIVLLFCRSSVSQTEKGLRECNESLQRLTSSDNPLSGFGQWMTDLVQTLHQNKRQFKHLPKGPIGKYYIKHFIHTTQDSCTNMNCRISLIIGSLIKIKDQQWCFAIECAIGFGNLCGFLVDNHEDEFKFKSLARQVIHRHPGKRVPTCFKSKFLVSYYRDIQTYVVVINVI